MNIQKIKSILPSGSKKAYRSRHFFKSENGQKNSVVKKEILLLSSIAGVPKGKLIPMLPIVGMFLILMLLFFFLFAILWKRNGKIQKGKSEVFKELDELKELAAKNQIIIEDKTKIPITELMYISEEKPFLKFHLGNGENLLMQGKIQTIKNELPPNFIICHPNYAVNSNFIKKINTRDLIVMNGDVLPIEVMVSKS